MAGSAHTWADGDVATATFLNALPRGVMGYANKTGDQTGITAVTDITSLTVTFTAISTRLYRTTVWMRCQQVTNASVPTGFITDGASAAIAASGITLAASAEGRLHVVYLETGISGSTTRKARASTASGTLSIFGTSYPSSIVVEDLGPA